MKNLKISDKTISNKKTYILKRSIATFVISFASMNAIVFSLPLIFGDKPNISNMGDFVFTEVQAVILLALVSRWEAGITYTQKTLKRGER